MIYVAVEPSETACLVCGAEPEKGHEHPSLHRWLGYLGGWRVAVCSYICAYRLGRGDERAGTGDRYPPWP